jgi:hypothetical protein
MDNTTDGGVQTMLESEFTFNLPHGVEDEDEDDVVHSPERSDEQNDQPTDDVADHNEVGNNSLFGDQDDAERPMNYDHFKPGFSDDEGGAEAFDRSWEGHKARKAPPKQKKSPRRSDNGDDEASPRAKRPRQSLFGGPSNPPENENHESCTESQSESAPVPMTPAAVLGDDMSGMHLDQEDTQDTSQFNQQYAHDNCPFSVGFGFQYFDRDNASPAPSRAVSEESVVIPPDDQVSPRLPLCLLNHC